MLFAVEMKERPRECDEISGRGEKRVAVVTFREQTPKILIGRPTVDTLYEKAFLTPRAEPDHEFDRNTSTWD